jgi:tripartite-type tricarboxylate transporter receptor subunit TctC
MNRTRRKFSANSSAAATATLAFAALLAWQPANAADFYEGKTINFIVGADVGGGYDIYARAIARHLARYVPGKPTIVVQNMPGAGSNKAAEYMFTQAPKDGTAIAILFPGAIMGPLLEEGAAGRFDPKQFEYLGTADSGTRVCVTWHGSKTKTFEDAQKVGGILGASQAGGSSRDYGFMLNNLAGTHFKVVSGYKGSAEISLAIERGEVDGMCGFDWTSIKSQKPDWVKDKKLNVLVQIALEPDQELTKWGAPHIWKFVSGENRKVMELIISQQVFGRPFLTPPATPPERVKILRDAFAATMRDKEFLADAEKVKIVISPLSGSEVQNVVKRLYDAPKEIIERAKKAIQPPGG